MADTQLMEQPERLPATSYGASLMEVIGQAARDPSVDIDKMERLIAMHERVQAREAETAYHAALSRLQPDLPIVDERGGIKGRDGKVQSTYALWEDVNEAIRPMLAAHGFSLTFRLNTIENGVAVTGVLAHELGHKEETTLALPADNSGSKNQVQAFGSSAQYGKRYTAFALLNITSTGEDDDGNKAGAKVVHEAARDAPFPQGPAKNKTELKAFGRDYWRDVEACSDADMLAALRGQNKALETQLRSAMPSWWNGGAKDGEPFDGLGDIIHRLETQFALESGQ
jgi:hypothetical protein